MNKKIRAITILLVIFFVPNVKAYDWDKCRKSLAKLGKDSGMYGGIATTTVFPSQFSSSWGACSALGKPEENRMAFFNDNFDMLKVDFARGDGEYVTTYISFYQCSDTGKKDFIKLVRSNYKHIFGTIRTLSFHEMVHPEDRSKNPNDWAITPKDSFTRLQDIIEKDEVVNQECKN